MIIVLKTVENVFSLYFHRYAETSEMLCRYTYASRRDASSVIPPRPAEGKPASGSRACWFGNFLQPF